MSRSARPGRRTGPNGLLYLVVGIPLAALLMGMVTLYIAFSHPDPGVARDAVPLSKTSWSEARPVSGEHAQP